MFRVCFDNMAGYKGFLCSNYDNKVVVISTPPKSIIYDGRSESLEFDCYMIAYVDSGTARIDINGTEYYLSEDSVCMLSPAHIVKFYEHSEDFVLTMVMRKQGVFPTISTVTPYRSAEMVVNLSLNPVLRLSPEEKKDMIRSREYLISQIERPESEEKNSFVYNAYERHSIGISHISRVHLLSDDDAFRASSHQNKIVCSLIEMIMTEYKKEHRAQYYADKMCYSLQYLNILTNRTLSTSISGIISRLLYVTSCALLSATDKTVQEIAFELNFADQATFCKFFKKMFGKSPSEFRKSEVSRLHSR